MFDCVPSSLPEVYWRFTRNDLKVKLRLFLGERQARILQDYQNLALVASQALGGSKKGDTDSEIPKTKEQIQAAFRSVFT